MTIAQKVVSFDGKPSITEAWSLYRYHFQALCAVHELGRSKYAAFSWQNDPLASNSTISNNVDALVRHISLHKTGYTQDAEGFPHLYHIACRIGMLITTWYRTQCFGTPTIDRPDTFANCESVLDSYINMKSSSVPGKEKPVWLSSLHITSEEIISCLKMYLPIHAAFKQQLDTTLDEYVEDPTKYLTYGLDLMQLYLLPFMSYSDNSSECDNSNELQSFTQLTPSDVLQYISAKLLHYVHTNTSTCPELIPLTRTPKQVAKIIAGYLKNE